MSFIILTLILFAFNRMLDDNCNVAQIWNKSVCFN